MHIVLMRTVYLTIFVGGYILVTNPEISIARADLRDFLCPSLSREQSLVTIHAVYTTTVYTNV